MTERLLPPSSSPAHRDYSSRHAARPVLPACLRRGDGSRRAVRFHAAVAKMLMKGKFPIRRTLQYLQSGEIIFKDQVRIMTINYNARGDLSQGARNFVFFSIPQIQYKNPWVQIMTLKNMTPSPFLRFYLDGGEQVLVDIEDKSHAHIVRHVKRILGKSEETLKEEEKAKMKLSNPANFGPRKYYLRECMCEVEGQVPCPGLVPLPKEMTGKYKNKLKAESEV